MTTTKKTQSNLSNASSAPSQHGSNKQPSNLSTSVVSSTGLSNKRKPVYRDDAARDTSSAGVSSKGSSSSARLDPQGPPPVFDPDTGAVQPDSVRRACDDLLNAIKTLKAGEASRMKSLASSIKELRQLAKNQAEEDRALPESVFALSCRDQFAMACEAAKDIASHFEPLPHEKLPFVTPAAKRDARAALAYRELAAFMNELKRMHLTAAAPLLMKEYGEIEAANMEQKAPGLGTLRPGASIDTSVTATASGGVGVASVSGSLTAGTVTLNDDDTDVDLFDVNSVSAQAKGSVGIASLLGKIGLSGGGKYFEHSDLDAVVQMRVNDAANRSPLGSSAGPTARRLRTGAQGVLNGVKWALGRDYLPEPSAPTFLSDKKVAKGYNTTKLNLLAKRLDAAAGPAAKPFSEIARSFYPSAARLAKHAYKTKQPLPVAHSPLNRASPVSEPFGKKLPFKGFSAEAKASVGADFSSLLGGNFKAGPQAAAALKYEVAQFDMRLSRSAHEILDTSCHHDLEQTFHLLRGLDDRLPADPAATAIPARLLHYARFRDRLVGTLADNLPDPNVPLFGANPPQQFRAAIQNPPLDMIRTAEEMCTEVSKDALLLAKHGAKLLAKPDRHDPPSIKKALKAERREAFKKLNDRLWNGCYPGTEAQALKNPKAFLARTHDALSLGLGLVGVHLHVQKEQQVDAATQAGVINQGSTAMYKADTAYETARELMDKTFVAIKKDNLVKDHASIVSNTLWRRHNLSFKVEAEGGMTTANVLGLADPAFQTVSVANSTGKAKVSLQVRAQLATHQPNPARLGAFIETTAKLETGVPFAGHLMAKAICEAIEKAFPGVTPEKAKLHAKEVVPVVNELLSAVRGRTSGVTVVMKSRHAPDTEGLNLQYVRLMSSTSTGVDVSGPVLGASVGGAVSESRTGVMLEAMGTDLGYHILQTSGLLEAVDAFKAIGNGNGNGNGKGKGKGKANGNGHGDIDLQGVFQANPWLANKYFAKGDTIISLLDRQRECVKDLADDNFPPAGQPLKNEFYRYYATEPFERIREVARQTAHHAPGKLAREHGTADAFKSPDSLQQIPCMETSDTVWNQMKAEVAALKTPAERMAYFCTDPNGKMAMTHYIAVMRDLKETNAATMHHTEERSSGFQAQVRTDAFDAHGKPFKEKVKGGLQELDTDSSDGSPHKDSSGNSAAGNSSDGSPVPQPMITVEDFDAGDDDDIITVLPNPQPPVASSSSSQSLSPVVKPPQASASQTSAPQTKVELAPQVVEPPQQPAPQTSAAPIKVDTAPVETAETKSSTPAAPSTEPIKPRKPKAKDLDRILSDFQKELDGFTTGQKNRLSVVLPPGDPKPGTDPNG